MSFMDRKNILSEGFFDFLKKLKAYRKLSPAEKRYMRNPEFRKAKEDFDDAIAKIEKELKKIKTK